MGSAGLALNAALQQGFGVGQRNAHVLTLVQHFVKLGVDDFLGNRVKLVYIHRIDFLRRFTPD